MTATPEQIAAAWAAWHSRHGGKLGPGPGFVEAIEAALAVIPKDSPVSISGAGMREALDEDIPVGETAMLERLAAMHPDDKAAEAFAVAMKAKLAKKRDEGRDGWSDKEQCSNSYLSQLLREHVAKGDPVDVANLAMMIHQRGERVGDSPCSNVSGRTVAPAEVYRVIKDVVIDKENVASWSRRIAAALSSKDSPVPIVGGSE